MTDVRIAQGLDGGEIEVVAGQLVMDDGLESAAYLSMFGGCDDDSGLEADNARQWWGNLIEPEPDRRYRSETQFLLNTLPLVPANLVRFRDAVLHDLAWLSASLASSIEVTVSIPALNTVQVTVEITIDDAAFQYVFTQAARARLEQQ